jgi:NAD/NADP transhydrogenase alpha subunit
MCRFLRPVVLAGPFAGHWRRGCRLAAHRLGAVVEGVDVPGKTREQVESLGAKFVNARISADGEGGYARKLTGKEHLQEQQVLNKHIAEVDVFITTPAVPRRPAPRSISRTAMDWIDLGNHKNEYFLS